MLDLNWSPKKTTKTKAQDAENLPQQRSQVQKQKATGQLPMKGNVDDGVEKKKRVTAKKWDNVARNEQD